MLKFVRRLCIVLSWLVLLIPSISYAMQSNADFWTAAIISGPLAKDQPITYYLEPDLRFIDDKYKFYQAAFWAGLGYKLSPHSILHAGVASITTKNTRGVYQHLNLPWQQVTLVLFESSEIALDSRTRIEEIKNTAESQWEFLVRERLLLMVPFKSWQGHSFEMSEEAFFNLKHPQWVESNCFVSQNRVFIGINNRLSKNVSFDIGYLNQYQFGNINQLSHVLAIGLQILTG